MCARKGLTTFVLLSGIVYLFTSATLFAQKQDVIYRKDTGKRMTVERVLAETYTEIRYKKGNKESRLTVDKVDRIVYYDEPKAWANGLSFAAKGEYENAINSFKLAKEDSGVREWIKVYCLLEMGKVYHQWGLSSPEKTKESINTYNELLQKYPDNRFYPLVLFNLAKAHSSSGDMTGALTQFDRLAQEAYDKKLGVEWEAKAKFEKAVARIHGGDFDEADRDLRSARTFVTEQLKSVGENQELAAELKRIEGLSRLYQGSVLINKKKFREATTFFKGIIDDKGSTRAALAGAECGLGECYMAEGKLKEAQAQFARAKVLFSDLREEGARATYYLGLVCLELKDQEPNYKTRAKNYFNEVVKGYPDTEWAKKAQAKID